MEKRKVYRQAGIGGFRRFLAAAAVLALMAASFTVGALAFSREVPVEQETIELPGIGLTLILPDSWKGRYEVEKDEGESWCRVYARSVLEKNPEWGGALFYVDRSHNRPMTPEELNEISPIACRYLFSTAGGTYSMNYASDVQWALEDPEQEREYRQMQEEISQIRFLVDGVLSD